MSSFGRDSTGKFVGEIKLVSTMGLTETIEYAINAYGHLIERSETISHDEFARRIAAAYDTTTPQNAAVVVALNCLL